MCLMPVIPLLPEAKAEDYFEFKAPGLQNEAKKSISK